MHNPNDEVETLREQRWLEREHDWDEEEEMDRRLAENFAPTGDGWSVDA